MRFYEFRKWFFDISGGPDEYLILFISQLKFGSNLGTYFQIHASRRSLARSFNTYISSIRTLGQKGNKAGRFFFDEGEVRFDNGNCSIRLEFEDCKINLEYSSDRITWPESPGHFEEQKNGFIDWVPLIPGGTASGFVKNNGKQMVFDNVKGYCDEVLSTILPWKVPVQHLHWGRLIHEKILLSWSFMMNRRSIPDSSRLYLAAKGQYYILENLTFETIQNKKHTSMNLVYADKYIIHGTSGDLDIVMEVSDHEEMIKNDFMDYSSKYGKMASGILRWISRNPHGIKFSASANIDIRIRDETYRLERVHIVDEHVEFSH